MASGGETRGQTAKRAAVQAAVMDATESLLGEGVSYAELNIERIARRAGISRTAFYFYFRDKRELLLRMTESVTDELFRQGNVWFTGDERPDVELRQALRNVAGLYRHHGDVLRAIVQAAATDEAVGRFWHAILDRFVDATEQRIASQQATGGGAVVEDARATAFALCWMTERTFTQHLVLGEPFAQDMLVDALTGVWVRAVYGA